MPKGIDSKKERLRRLEQMVTRLHKDGEDDGPGDRVVCYYDGKLYSPGARCCQVKKVMVCKDDGTWDEVANESAC